MEFENQIFKQNRNTPIIANQWQSSKRLAGKKKKGISGFNENGNVHIFSFIV